MEKSILLPCKINPVKAPAIFICPSKKIEKEQKKETAKRQQFPKKFVTDSVNKAIRKQRYCEKTRTKLWGRVTPLAMRTESYNNIFNKLLESRKCYFTSEYGKNEDDYKRFIDGKINIYENTGDNEKIIRDRRRYFKRMTVEEKVPVISSSLIDKRSKQSLLGRAKSKSKILSKTMHHSKTRLKLARKKSKSARKSRRGTVKVMIEEEEKSLSAISVSHSQTSDDRKSIISGKQWNPFVFKLSDPAMKEQGITANYELPIRVITFPTMPHNPLTFWFQKRPMEFETFYPEGRICLKFGKEGSGTVYYKNGDPAISFVFGRLGPLIIVYTESFQSRGKRIRQVPVAIFDLRGNGVVYDLNGRKRLVYDQAQGILLDSPSKFPLRWQWESFWEVMGRRAELEFLPQTNLTDFMNEKKNVEKDRKFHSRLFHSKRRDKMKGALSVVLKEQDLNKKIRHNLKIPSANSGMSRRPSIASNLKIPKSNVKDVKDSFTRKKSHPSIIHKNKPPENKSNRQVKRISSRQVPKLLKFVGKGFVIQPILTPCSQIYHVTIVRSSSLPKESVASALATARATAMVTATAMATATKRSRRGLKNRMRSRRQLVQPGVVLVPLKRCSNVKKTKLLLKPIVMRITNNVSLTIKDQHHIHIDFISHPMHYMFSLGVIVNTDVYESIFDIRDSEARRETLPSIFELLKFKCKKLFKISNAINKMRADSESKHNREKHKKLQTWGHERLLDKLPLCQLMDNKCVCMECSCKK